MIMGFFYWRKEDNSNQQQQESAPRNQTQGFFYWGKENNPNRTNEISHHEEVHARACQDLGMPVRWVWRGNERVVASDLGSGSKDRLTKGAIALMAGALAGGGDADGDYKAAAELAQEAGISVQEVERRARKYL
jgi:hypothetical protein